MMKTLLVICLLSLNASAQLFPRVQADIICTNLPRALQISNVLASAASTNLPRLLRTTSARATIDPSGVFRFHCCYEFTNSARASNLWTIATNNIPPQTSGRLLFYFLPEEGSLSDWGGADCDRRAQAVEVTW